MQPNTYLQPNTYYQVQQPPKPPKAKSSVGAIIAAILFALLAAGLGVFILVDKLVLSKQTETSADTLEQISINAPLSEAKIPANSAEDSFKHFLAERTFTVNNVVDQYITFKNDSEYVYSYYRTPSVGTDHYQNVPSEQHGTYIVKDKTITLSSGDEFTITNDYLVKTVDKLSNNKNTVYFDLNQLPTVQKGLAASMTDFTKASQEEPEQIVNEYAVQKVEIASYSCAVEQRHMAKADSYICDSYLDIYFNSKDIEKSDLSFTDFCKIVVETINNPLIVPKCVSLAENLGSVTMRGYFIVRVKDSKYEITGTYLDESNAPRPDEDTTPDQDSPAED